MQTQQRVELTVDALLESDRLTHLNCDYDATIFTILQRTESAKNTANLAFQFMELSIQRSNLDRWMRYAIDGLDSHGKEIQQKIEIAKEQIRQLNPIATFRGTYRFLSNFYPVPITYFGLTFTTTEHAYQAAKTKDPLIQAKFAASDLTPGDSKKLGRSIVVRTDWEEVKFRIMAELLIQKFKQRDLSERLLATGYRPLIEGNWWHDNIWGCCFCSRCTKKEYKGLNALGTLLMYTRETLRGNL